MDGVERSPIARTIRLVTLHSSSPESVDSSGSPLRSDVLSPTLQVCQTPVAGSGGGRLPILIPSTKKPCHPAAARKIAESLVRNAVKLVCFDFDHTLVSIHTEGWWDGSAAELAEYVRPEFSTLIPMLLDSGVFVCIVTFSPQTDVIREVLCECFGANLASGIPIRGDDGTWSTSPEDFVAFGIEDCACGGKLKHIVSAAKEITSTLGASITCSQTVLLDDDPTNINCAEDYQVPAILYEGSRFSECDMIIDMINRLRLTPEKLAHDGKNTWKTPSPEPVVFPTTIRTAATPVAKATRQRRSLEKTPVLKVTAFFNQSTPLKAEKPAASATPGRKRQPFKENKRPLHTPSPAFKTHRNPPKRFNKMKKTDSIGRISGIEDSMSELQIADGFSQLMSQADDPATPRKRVTFR